MSSQASLLNPTLPKVDLHRHLEGAVRLETVIEISQAHGLPLPASDRQGLAQHAWIDRPTGDILQLLPKFDLLRLVFVDTDACRRVTWECLEDAANEGLDYVELRFSPLFMAEPHGLDPMSVTGAVCEAWQEARVRLPVRARLVAILSRTYGPAACEIELECALAYRERGIVGLDLAGDEARHPAAGFREHFRRAREAGLRLTAHAGEFAGAESVRETIAELAPERLGHAVRAADDPALLDLIAERGIAVECCPTSNVLTTSVAAYSRHPLPAFLAHGICATLNTDDPALMGDLRLEDEYRHAQSEMSLTRADLDRIQLNSLQAAFLSEDEKVVLLERIKQRITNNQ
jgi:adenosine deaminase